MQMFLPRFYKRRAYVELLSASTVRFTSTFRQKTFNLNEGYNYFELINFTKLDGSIDEYKLIENYKFVIRIDKNGLNAGSAVFGYDSTVGAYTLGYVCIGSGFGDFYPKAESFEAKIEDD